MRRRIGIACMALGFGVWLSFVYTYVPFEGETLLLSELVCQLSGDKLGFGMGELLKFTLVMLPFLVFQAYMGTMLYRNYCTASVYVFSRIPKRLVWYRREVVALGVECLAYQLLVVLSAVVVSMRLPVILDGRGVELLIYRVAIWSMWTFACTLGINLLAIRFDSSVAFAAVVGVQAVFISLFTILAPLQEQKQEVLLETLKRINPVSCLVLGWHTSRFWEGQGIIYIQDSLLAVVVMAAVVTWIGARVVKNYDLLVSDVNGE